MQLLNKARKQIYKDKLGRTWKWDKTAGKYRYVRKGSHVASPVSNVLKQQFEAASDEAINSIVGVTKRSSKLSAGQKVKYIGSGRSSSMQGTLLGIGKGGAALIKFDNGYVKSSRWKNVEAVGEIKARSIYEGLHKGELLHLKENSKINGAVKKCLQTKIKDSKLTIQDLCEAFDDKGFTIMLVGGSVRDILKNKEAKDLDFIADCSDNAIKSTVGELDPTFLVGAEYNSILGLVSFKDIDITPIHLYNKEVGTIKGGTLAEDAKSRDFMSNSLQLDPLRGVLIDGMGKGIDSINDNKLIYCDSTQLKQSPRYLLRYFKFLARGWHATAETRKATKDNMSAMKNLSKSKVKSFFVRQILKKDGVAQISKVFKLINSYDKDVANSIKPIVDDVILNASSYIKGTKK